MCGICGWFDLVEKNIVKNQEYLIKEMLKAIRHRGPDGNDYYYHFGGGRSLSMGFCRLSFVDLQGGMQPLSNEDESVYLTCNGEIFNYKELREGLIAKGHHFKTKTDVEVIVHLYEEYGLNFVDYLNG